jgi:phenylpyruvate tautomerase PptA (4-oxalocrotonate tautomerase family)
MTTITLKVNERTKAGKTVLSFLKFITEESKGVEVLHTPNYETLIAIQEAQKGKVIRAKNSKDLFKKLKS